MVGLYRQAPNNAIPPDYAGAFQFGTVIAKSSWHGDMRLAKTAHTRPSFGPNQTHRQRAILRKNRSMTAPRAIPRYAACRCARSLGRRPAKSIDPTRPAYAASSEMRRTQMLRKRTGLV